MDFNNETTATISPSNLIKILVLQRRHDFIEAQEHYFKFLSEDVETPVSVEMVRARLRSLYFEVVELAKRNWKPIEVEKFEEVFSQDKNPDIYELLDSFKQLNKLLDSTGLLRIDTKKQYDATSFEKSNKAFGI